MFARSLRGMLALLALCSALAVNAQSADDAASSEFDLASAAATAAQVPGPTTIPLASQARLALPEGYAYIPPTEAARLMRAMGNYTDEGFMGLIVGDEMAGFMTIRFEQAGYIKDDDARDWDADELLQNLKEGTEAGNEERRQRGIPEFVVDGWIEPPHYDAANRRLIWSARLLDKHPAADARAGVNYNTYLLGRDGYISMNLITDADNVDSQKPIAWAMLDALNFNDGKRYADFNADTDSVATYGLAALVGGVAAKKLGLLATLGVFLAKFWKIAALAVVGFGAGIRKFFGGKQGD